MQPILIEKLFTKAEALAQSNVSITDKDENCQLICYASCNQDDPDIVKRMRGVVFHDENPVLLTFPFTPELTDNDTTIITDLLNPIFSQCKFFDAYEGCLIRVFFCKKWYFSTNRKLNCF